MRCKGTRGVVEVLSAVLEASAHLSEKEQRCNGISSSGDVDARLFSGVRASKHGL